MGKTRRKRRVKGTGALFYSARRGVWIGRVACGRNDDGSVHYRERSASTVEELQAKLAAVRPPGPTVTIAEWLTRWLAAMQVRPRTRAIRAEAVKGYIVPVLGNLRVSDLTPLQIESACREWGRPDGLAPNTVRLTCGVLRTALNAARRVGLRGDNPVSLAVLPRGERTRIDPYSPEELRRIIQEATSRPVTRAIALLASTGCRLGEALGLDCSDFDGESVSITRTQHPDGTSGPPKTDNGFRTIPVPDLALPALVAAKAKRKVGPLFLDKHGGRLIHHRLQYAWKGIVARLKLTFQSPHKLRHAVASAMDEDGWPVTQIARALGDSPAQIVKTYIHAGRGWDARAASNRMLMSGGTVGATRKHASS